MTALTEIQQLNLRIKCAEDAGWKHIKRDFNGSGIAKGQASDGDYISTFYREIPALTYETLRGVIERMSEEEKAIFVNALTYKVNCSGHSAYDIMTVLTAPLPTIALCIAKAKGWEI